MRVACVLAAVYVVLATRAVLEARGAYAQAQLALASGDAATAVVRLRSAARWYAPGNPYVGDAIDALLRVGAQAERRGQRGLALAAYRGCHAAIHAATSIYTPYKASLRRADDRIAALMAATRPPELEADRKPRVRRAAYLQALQEKKPRVGFVALAVAGFATWLVALRRYWLTGPGAEDPLAVARARRSLWTAMGGFGCFLVGLAFA